MKTISVDLFRVRSHIRDNVACFDHEESQEKNKSMVFYTRYNLSGIVWQTRHWL
jgi:hypothetical protein